MADVTNLAHEQIKQHQQRIAVYEDMQSRFGESEPAPAPEPVVEAEPQKCLAPAFIPPEQAVGQILRKADVQTRLLAFIGRTP